MNAKRFLNGLVLVFLVTLGILCLPPVRTRVEKTLYPCKYSALVEQYAAEYDLDPLLVYSFVRTESGFDPDATSSVEARGLMQMTEETFLWLRSKIAEGENVTFGDLYDPAVSLRFGCYYLHLCMERYGGDVAPAASCWLRTTTAAGARWMRCCKRKNTPPTASRCRGFPTTRCTTTWKRSPPAMQCIRTCMALDSLEPGLPV